MEKIQILSIGGDPVILQILLRCINEHPKWEGTGTVSEEDAITIFHQRKFDIILFTTGIKDEAAKKLNSLFSFQYPGIIFIEHYDGGCGLLFSEIQDALNKKNQDALENTIKKQINVTDDVFKNKKPGD
jgi:hypothetical protein